MIYIGLDLAKTTGIAVLFPEQKKIYSYEIMPSAVTNYNDGIISLYEQINQLLINFPQQPTIVIEKFVYFAKSRQTQLQLAKLYGFVSISLYAKGYSIIESMPLQARKQAGFTKEKNNKKFVQAYFSDLFQKKLTNNETDAITLCVASAINDGKLLLDDVAILNLRDRKEIF